MATPLIQAVEGDNALAEVGNLLRAGADVNATDTKKRTPLHHAARIGDVAVVAALLSAGASVDPIDKIGRGSTPLCNAAGYGHDRVVEVLLTARADVNGASCSASPLQRAAESGSLSIVRTLLGAGATVDRPDKSSRTPLYFAAGAGDVAVVDALLAAGADVDAPDKNGVRPLSYAMQMHDPSRTLASTTALIIELLIAGADVDAVDVHGSTAVHTAAANCYANHLMPPLLLAGANVEGGKRSSSRTPLHLSAGVFSDASVGHLLDAGAQADTITSGGINEGFVTMPLGACALTASSWPGGPTAAPASMSRIVETLLLAVVAQSLQSCVV